MVEGGGDHGSPTFLSQSARFVGKTSEAGSGLFPLGAENGHTGTPRHLNDT